MDASELSMLEESGACTPMAAAQGAGRPVTLTSNYGLASLGRLVLLFRHVSGTRPARCQARDFSVAVGRDPAGGPLPFTAPGGGVPGNRRQVAPGGSEDAEAEFGLCLSRETWSPRAVNQLHV